MKRAFRCALGLCLLSAAASAAESGCATGNNASSMGGSGGVAGSGDATTSGSGATSQGGQGGQAGGGGEVTVGSGVGGTGTGGQVSYLAYAHTNKTLFEFDPSAASLSTKTVGDFDCIGGAGQDTAMTDLAVNQNGDVWGISETAIYSLVVQGTKVHCATKIPLNNATAKFYALTFVPAGVLDPNSEVLVAGNTAGELWAVDEKGNLSLHGNFGNVPANDGNGHTYNAKNQGKRWELSGDIVFLANKGSPVGFATVRDCPTPPSNTGCDGTDTLLEIDMTKLKTATTQSVTKSVRGQIVKKAGCNDAGNGSGYGSMYGIAAWNDKVFGFSHDGAIVDIDNKNGEACLILNQPSNYWDGAGVTTLAQVIDPEPK